MRSCAKLFLLVTFLFCALACDKKQSVVTQPSSTTEKVTVVSLSPAATDLIVAFGAADQLIGVSTFDNDPAVASLPKVGDYENVDWERIATIRPRKMIVQMAKNRIPDGMKQRANELGVTLVDVQIDRLIDVHLEITRLGNELKRNEDAKKLADTFREELDEVRREWMDSPKVKTLLVTSDGGTGIAGTKTYLDDVLQIAGGENVAGHDGYFQADKEMLITMKPEVIVQLLPDATPAQIESAQKFWSSLPTIPAVANDRILIVTDSWSLKPGPKLGELAQKISRHLHPESSTLTETKP